MPEFVLVILVVVPLLAVRVAAMRVGMAIAYRRMLPELWTGETVKLSGPAFLRIGTADARLRRGYLYLTDLRLLWMPAVLMGMLPKRGLEGEPISIRTTHVESATPLERASILRDGVAIAADGVRYWFYFKHPAGFLLGGSTSSKQWLSALRGV
ncbi:MAG TPA: hypothetical protein VII57_10120 [Dehalococcoidia bacterium]